jgi:hypothetical protein
MLALYMHNETVLLLLTYTTWEWTNPAVARICHLNFFLVRFFTNFGTQSNLNYSKLSLSKLLNYDFKLIIIFVQMSLEGNSDILTFKLTNRSLLYV